MKYGDLNLGQIEALVNKLGGKEGVKAFLAGDIRLERPKERYTFKKWRSVPASRHIFSPARDTYLDVFKAHRVRLLDSQEKLFRATHIFGHEAMDLALVTPPELGFKYGGFYKNILEEAQERGLQVAPPDLAFTLRVSYLDQSPGGRVIVMSEIVRAYLYGGIWAVARQPGGDRDLELISESASENAYFHADTEMVFVLPKATRKK